MNPVQKFVEHFGADFPYPEKAANEFEKWHGIELWSQKKKHEAETKLKYRVDDFLATVFYDCPSATTCSFKGDENLVTECGYFEAHESSLRAFNIHIYLAGRFEMKMSVTQHLERMASSPDYDDDFSIKYAPTPADVSLTIFVKNSDWTVEEIAKFALDEFVEYEYGDYDLKEVDEKGEPISKKPKH